MAEVGGAQVNAFVAWLTTFQERSKAAGCDDKDVLDVSNQAMIYNLARAARSLPAVGAIKEEGDEP